MEIIALVLVFHEINLLLMAAGQLLSYLYISTFIFNFVSFGPPYLTQKHTLIYNSNLDWPNNVTVVSLEAGFELMTFFLQGSSATSYDAKHQMLSFQDQSHLKYSSSGSRYDHRLTSCYAETLLNISHWKRQPFYSVISRMLTSALRRSSQLQPSSKNRTARRGRTYQGWCQSGSSRLMTGDQGVLFPKHTWKPSAWLWELGPPPQPALPSLGSFWDEPAA